MSGIRHTAEACRGRGGVAGAIYRPIERGRPVPGIPAEGAAHVAVLSKPGSPRRLVLAAARPASCCSPHRGRPFARRPRDAGTADGRSGSRSGGSRRRHLLRNSGDMRHRQRGDTGRFRAGLNLCRGAPGGRRHAAPAGAVCQDGRNEAGQGRGDCRCVPEGIGVGQGAAHHVPASPGQCALQCARQGLQGAHAGKQRSVCRPLDRGSCCQIFIEFSEKLKKKTGWLAVRDGAIRCHPRELSLIVRVLSADPPPHTHTHT